MDDLNNAINSVTNGTVSIRKAAELYSVPFRTLAKKLSGHSPANVTGSGRKTALSTEAEGELCEYLKVCGKYGYGLNKNEEKDLVHDYVSSKHLKNPFNP